MLRIYNTLTRKKEKFQPIVPGKVGLYVCGMTVYDLCHVGHARVMVVFDVVVRYLRASGYDVRYIRNITDIDDKIIRRAAESGIPVGELTQRYIDAMHEDAAALGVLAPDVEPRATEVVEDMVEMIGRLIERGFAYAGGNGDVYYDVSAFPDYGRLSDRRLEDLRAGARVEVDEAKNDPLDFVLWKAAKPGEPSWPSPWGPGRPGWHIECSAMSTRCLGNHFDIHGGGMDLQFPHHENEIAQSEGATGEPFVNVWMHNGFVRVDDEKMSKSLGNFFTVREVLAHFPAEVVRYFMVSSHYRSALNYGETHLRHAWAALSRLYTALRGMPDPGDEAGERDEDDAVFEKNFRAAMDDDFNTPRAIAVLFELAREMNRARESRPLRAAALAGELRRLGGILGILGDQPDRFLRLAPGEAGLGDAEIEARLKARQAAREARDFATADRIRDELGVLGIAVEDGPAGSVWRRSL